MHARVPLPAWVRGYRASWLRGDLLAGVTITAYLVPQVMAYAELAGLPAVVGLWASIGGLAGYAFLGTSRRLSVGPESTTALMTAAAIGAVGGAAANPTAFAVALCFVVAGLCVIGWAAGVSVLAELLSRPVLVGYLAGIAVLMVGSQLGNLTGVPGDTEGFAGEVAHLARHLDEVNYPTLALGLTTLVAMLAASARFPRAPVALAGMVAATVASIVLGLPDRGVEVIGSIPAALPTPGLPDVGLGDVTAMLWPALAVAFVAYTDVILTGRGFATRHGERIDAKRELLAMGAANLGAGLMQGFPVSSSGSRTAIGDAVGGRSQLTGMVTMVSTVLAVVALRPVLEEFPMPALAAVVGYAAVRLVDVGELRRFAAFRRSELVLALATVVGVVAAGVLVGILVAIGLSILDLLRRVARPHDAVEGYVPGVAGMHNVADYPDASGVPGMLVYRYDSPLFFANAEDFRARALAAVDAADPPPEWFLLNTESIVEVDITAVDALEALRAELAGRGIVFAIARLKQDLANELAPSGFLDRVGKDRLFPTLPTAVEAFKSR